MPVRSNITGLIILSVLFISACQLNNGAAVTEDIPDSTAVVLRIPSVTSTITPSATHTPTPTETTIPTIIPSQTPTSPPTLTPTITPSFTPSASPTPASREHYVFIRPINRSNDTIQDYIERTYPYGGTAFGRREVHPGVEFVNPAGTPVRAVMDGTVIFAGQDDTQSQIYGPRLNYYGNLIIVQHDITDSVGDPVSTVYAHLSQMDVSAGDTVQIGQTIGRVGQTGIAIGPHLHFEVRAGDAFNVNSVRNPALWIKPYAFYGTLAGRVSFSSGRNTAGMVIIAEAINGSVSTRETYVYGSEMTGGDAAWDENFALPDLPEGNYRIILQEDGITYDIKNVTISAGKTAWLAFDIDR